MDGVDHLPLAIAKLKTRAGASPAGGFFLYKKKRKRRRVAGLELLPCGLRTLRRGPSLAAAMRAEDAPARPELSCCHAGKRTRRRGGAQLHWRATPCRIAPKNWIFGANRHISGHRTRMSPLHSRSAFHAF